jgi:DNA-binding NarL/FixJ family response regulator
MPEPVPVVRVTGPDDAMSKLAGIAEERGAMRVALAEDSVLLREGIQRLLTEAGFKVISAAGDADELLANVRRAQPQVVISDIRMPPTFTDEGLRAAHQIREEFPEVSVLLLSQHVETEFAVELVSAGAGRLGYLLKDRVSNIQEFTDAVKRVGQGGSVIDPEVVSRLVGRARRDNPLDALTDKEREVLSLMAEGRSNQAISRIMNLSTKSIEGHVRNIFTKLDLDSTPDDHRRVLAVLKYLQQ